MHSKFYTVHPDLILKQEGGCSLTLRQKNNNGCYNYVKDFIDKNIYCHFPLIYDKPSQYVPFPLKPSLHVHIKEPNVSSHTAYSWQPWFPLHSFISISAGRTIKSCN